MLHKKMIKVVTEEELDILGNSEIDLDPWNRLKKDVNKLNPWDVKKVD